MAADDDFQITFYDESVLEKIASKYKAIVDFNLEVMEAFISEKRFYVIVNSIGKITKIESGSAPDSFEDYCNFYTQSNGRLNIGRVDLTKEQGEIMIRCAESVNLHKVNSRNYYRMEKLANTPQCKGIKEKMDLVYATITNDGRRPIDKAMKKHSTDVPVAKSVSKPYIVEPPKTKKEIRKENKIQAALRKKEKEQMEKREAEKQALLSSELRRLARIDIEQAFKQELNPAPQPQAPAALVPIPPPLALPMPLPPAIVVRPPPSIAFPHANNPNPPLQTQPNPVGNANQSQPQNEELNICCICEEAPRDCIIMECFHLCCCSVCAKALKDCPICRGKITKVQKVFFA